MRRGVLRALGAYIAIVWLLAQGLVDLLPAFGFPEWAIRVFLGITVAATPFVGVVAWKYDLTRKGFLRDAHDVALARMIPTGRALGPTTRATPRGGVVRSTVIATWTGQNGEHCEKEFPGKFHIGRDFGADVRLWDDRVSRRHVEVYPVGDQWYVKDMSSLNGSYVDHEPIDTVKIERILEVSLDRGGPKVLLAVQVMQDTLMTATKAEPPDAGA